MKPLTEKQYVDALEKMKASPRDRIGILGELGATGMGAAAGAALSGAAAGAAGAATFAGSSTLASIMGGVFITTTPVGWIVGSVAVGAGVGYAISKLVRSGGKADVYRVHSIQELEARIKQIRAALADDAAFEEKFQQVITGVQYLVVNGRIDREKATELIAGVERKIIDVNDGLKAIEDLAAA
ncbi:hypothetical protein [Marinobacter sp.]|uniref:hypothetical protein n=1 Tax=Marinobacter sp. TaxID=50741 RepID=UPI003A954DE1